MKKILNSKGFAALEVALVVVVMGIIGGSGFYVYNSQKETKRLLESANSASSANSPKVPKKTPQPKPQEVVPEFGYLELKSEGVKIMLSESIKDAYYDERGVFSVRSLDNIAGCRPHEVSNSGGNFWRGVAGLNWDKQYDSEVAAKKSRFKENPNAVQVGKSWYSIGASPEDCKSTDPTVQAKITRVQNAFVEASKTFTKI